MLEEKGLEICFISPQGDHDVQYSLGIAGVENRQVKKKSKEIGESNSMKETITGFA